MPQPEWILDAGLQLKKNIGKMAQPTFGPEVLRGIGFFGGLYEFKGYKQPVLVSHVDGVGTKMKIAIALDKHDTIGMDIVNHWSMIFLSAARHRFSSRTISPWANSTRPG